jgi:hypothetical protein
MTVFCAVYHKKKQWVTFFWHALLQACSVGWWLMAGAGLF